MLREEFLDVCSAVETERGISAGNGWKAIRSMNTKENMVFDFRHYFISNKIYFIDIVEDGSRLCGFIVIDPEDVAYSDIIRVNNVLTYIPITAVTAIEFLTSEYDQLST